MIRARDVPAAVQWHEGMLLAPQHLQQQALRCEELIHYHAHLADPYHYGVVQLEIDRALLSQGLLRVLRLEAILPDGLVVSHGPEDRALELVLTDVRAAARSGPVTVHLVVAADKRAATSADGDLARYRSVTGAPVLDESTGETLALPELHPRLHLVAGIPAAHHCALPLLTIRCEGESFVPQDEYVPPLLHVEAGSTLEVLCTRLTLQVRDKAMYLLETLRASTAAVQRSQTEESERLIYQLTAGLPALEAQLRTGKGRPFALYTSLCALAGHIAAVGDTPIPPVFPIYDHSDPARAFREVAAFVVRAIHEGVSETYLRVPMDRDGDAFAVHFLSEWAGRELVLGVVAQPGVSERQVGDWVLSARVGARTALRAMRDRRVLGLAREPVARRGGLVARRGMHLFVVKPDAKALQPGETLAVENTTVEQSLPAPAQMYLYIRVKN